MAYQSLYRKYRPQNFSDVVGQGHVVRTLQNAILSGRVAHGYLFTGTRGTAKTTVARLLAKALNCESSDRPVAEPCNSCNACKSITSGSSIDVIEMDAASHRGVADIEEVRKSVGYGPMELRYKVFIIDEAHQLSSDAKDAFLKTLEEPPANVVFILATTEPQAIPITIRSRCQQFDFKRGSLAEIASRLRYVLDCENVTYTPDAINLVARGAEGSYRDSLSLLEQVLAFAPQRITASEVNLVLGTLDADALGQVIESVARRDAPTAFALAGQLLDSGKEARTLMRTLSGHFRDLLLVSVGGPAVGAELSPDEVGRLQQEARHFTPHQMMAAMDTLNEAQGETRWNNQHRLLVELTFLKLMNLGDGSGAPLATAPIIFTTAPAPPAFQPLPQIIDKRDLTPPAPVIAPVPVATPPVAPPVAVPVAQMPEEDEPVLPAAFFAPDAIVDAEDDLMSADNSEDADEADEEEDSIFQVAPAVVTPPAPVAVLPVAPTSLVDEADEIESEQADAVPEIDTSPGLFEDSLLFANAASPAPAAPTTPPVVVVTTPSFTVAAPPPAPIVARVEEQGEQLDEAPVFTDADAPPLEDTLPRFSFAPPIPEDEPEPEVVAEAEPPASGALFGDDDLPTVTVDIDDIYRSWPQFLNDAARISKQAELMLLKAQPHAVRGHTVDIYFKDRASMEMMSSPKKQEFVRKLLSRCVGAPRLAVHFALSPDVAPLPPRTTEKKKQRVDILDAIDQLGTTAPSFGSDAPAYPSFSSAPSATFSAPLPTPGAVSSGGMGSGAAILDRPALRPEPPRARPSAPAPLPKISTDYGGVETYDETDTYHPAMAHPLMQDVLQLFGGRIITD